jgi:hypothetical protein
MVDIAERGYEHLILQHSSFLFPISRYSSLETRAGVMPLTSMLISKAIDNMTAIENVLHMRARKADFYVRTRNLERQAV